MVKLVHSTLYDALKAGASDIHLETTNSQLVIKYRLDGVLSMMGTAQGLDMAERLSHMDGLIVAPGFGSRGVEGKIQALNHARPSQQA